MSNDEHGPECRCMTPEMLAQFDQAMAASTDLLTNLIKSYVLRRHEDQERGWPAPVTVIEMAESVGSQWDVDQMSSALSAAVVMLSDHYVVVGQFAKPASD